MRDPKHRLATALFVGVLVSACASQVAGADNLPSDQDFAKIQRGRYLAAVADCAACHTQPGSGVQYGGGRPIPTPFGKVLAANITPDAETGIGTWSDAQFDAAVRLGRGPDGTRLYPAMPFPYYVHMTQEDVLAIRAYLNTLPPVHNAVKSNQLPFPFDIRASMAVWDALYFDTGPLKLDSSKSAEWNRGAYLVRGAGHCAACHTPKTSLGGDIKQQGLQGQTDEGWFAPDITSDPDLGLGHWSVEDIVTYLKTGHNRIAAASGPMGEEVADSSSRMTDADLRAVAVYLKDQPGTAPSAKPLSPHDPQMVAGGAIYRDLCSACHASDGSGVPYLIPNLALASSVASREPTSILRVVIHGAQSVATAKEPTAPAMPAFGWQLTDAQIAAVTNYIRNSWGHAAPALTTGEVHKARELNSGSG